MKKAEKNYSETFMFGDIPGQLYPVYVRCSTGKIVNFKSIIQPNPRSRKKFTRRKQLIKRSLQAKIFDSLINIGYFDPLPVIKEFPIVILNSKRLKGQDGLFVLLDYYFPTLGLAVELDSDYHDPDKDKIRDEYLKELGITTFRINGLEKESVQKSEFKKLTALMRSIKPLQSPLLFDFCTENL